MHCHHQATAADRVRWLTTRAAQFVWLASSAPASSLAVCQKAPLARGSLALMPGHRLLVSRFIHRGFRYVDILDPKWVLSLRYRLRGPQAQARSSIQGLSVDSRTFTQGGLGLQVILNMMSVFVLAQNHANIAHQSLSFNEASTVKLEFWVKNRPKSVHRSLSD